MHYSVLLNESIELLKINSEGIYVDGTFGRGGHSIEILKRLTDNGKLIAFDKDIEAVEFAKDTIKDRRFIMCHESFANIEQKLLQLDIDKIDGLILDLGVSSPQIDKASRGFSFRFDNPLDMRMDNTKGINAKDWINSVNEVELSNILWQYGEEKQSRKIASNIVKARQKKIIETTVELADIIASSLPRKEKGQHPATRSFQAIRIFINNELADLETILSKIPNIIKKGGRIVVISFHSLEDRIVKNQFKKLTNFGNLPKWVMAENKPAEYKIIAKKVRASSTEITENTRSRSAILRSLERV